MKIVLNFNWKESRWNKEKDGTKQWSADCKDLPGSPPLGFGREPHIAVANLFLELINDKRSNWLSYTDTSKLEVEITEKGV